MHVVRTHFAWRKWAKKTHRNKRDMCEYVINVETKPENVQKKAQAPSVIFYSYRVTVVMFDVANNILIAS